MFLARSPALFRFAFLLACLGLGIAFFIEHHLQLRPCSLCQTQRVLLGGFALTCLAALLQRPGQLGWRVYSMGALMLAVLGTASASRQVWVQTHPPQVCPGWVTRPLNELAPGEWIRALALGDADCQGIAWSFLDLSLPEWSLLMFVSLGVMLVAHLLRQRG